LKDVGKTQLFGADPPFPSLATLDTGPITNHVNFVRNKNSQFAYISVGGENVVKVYTTGETLPDLVATIPTGELPHGIWPSGDGTHIYVALENGAGINAINTLTNEVEARIPGGHLLRLWSTFRTRSRLEMGSITSNRWLRLVCLRISSWGSREPRAVKHRPASLSIIRV
jgi:hypothetical protein